MLIIALGESVLAIGLSAQEHITEPAYLLAVLLAMVLISLLWWVHFADDVALARVERVIGRPQGVSPRTALIAFSLGYLVLQHKAAGAATNNYMADAIGWYNYDADGNPVVDDASTNNCSLTWLSTKSWHESRVHFTAFLPSLIHCSAVPRPL